MSNDVSQRRRAKEQRIYQLKLRHLNLGKVSRGKAAVLLVFVQITPPPPPQFGQLVQLFVNAENVDLHDLLSKILLKKGRILALWVM